MTGRAAIAPFAAALAMLASAGSARAGFTETLPADAFMLDIGLADSSVKKAYDNEGNSRPLIDDIERYEPGGGLQGVIKPDADVRYLILVNQLRYGLWDDLSAFVGVPVVLYNKVRPRLGWVPGDYQGTLGRPYGEEDFWQWAASMRQPRPGTWTGNTGALGDVVLGGRWRFSDRITGLEGAGLRLSLTAFGSLPTGRKKDPEEIVAAGTTSWDLHSMGELGFHLSADKSFAGRLTIGLDLFHEFLFRHTYQTPSGTRHPLLLDQEPYVGETYTIDPGDFSGAAGQVDAVVWKGPVFDDRLARRSGGSAEDLPPMLAASLKYTFTRLGQSDWESDSALWDWDQEKSWRPGYKNTLNASLTVSFLRFGAPMQAYLDYRNQSWIPGRNCRAADVITVGARAIAKFW